MVVSNAKNPKGVPSTQTKASEDNSRKAKRKEARMNKKQMQHLKHIDYQKKKCVSLKSKKAKFGEKKKLASHMNELESLASEIPKNILSRDSAGIRGKDRAEEQSISSDAPKSTHSSSKDRVIKDASTKEKKSLKRKKTKFEEFLEMEGNIGLVSAEEDLLMERKLTKKLKIKQGKLPGAEDEMNNIIKDIPSVLESLGDGQVPKSDDDKKLVRISSKKHKRKKVSVLLEERREDESTDDIVSKGSKIVSKGTVELTVKETCTKAPKSNVNVKYVAPQLRRTAGAGSAEYIQTRRQVRGLLNKLSDSNVEQITIEFSNILKAVGRSMGTDIIVEQVLSSLSEQHAGVFAAFVAGMACSVGIDFGAKLIVSLASCFEDEHKKEDNFSLRKFTLLLSYLYLYGVCSSDLIYDFLALLSKRLMEIDVSTILTILRCCGMKLRSDDPAAMQNLIENVQNRVNELKSAAGDAPDNQLKINNKRMNFMLQTILEIKNNRKSKDNSAHHAQVNKWLQKSGVDRILLKGLKWDKLLDPGKKGQWWLPGDMASTADDVEEFASKIDQEVSEAQKLLQLAAAQGMNTDTRRAIFCIIMSGDDYLDTFEKLRGLDLPGKQDREIIRILVMCCLQEKVFNKYYTVLASKLCSHDKSHKITLQYYLWDRFKEIESMELIKLMNLARFIAEMLTSFSLSLAVLKAVELSDLKQLTPKKIMHFRMLFEAIFKNTDAVVWNIFTRVAMDPDLEPLRDGLVFFIKQYVASTNDNTISEKFKIARKALSNIEGILM